MQLDIKIYTSHYPNTLIALQFQSTGTQARMSPALTNEERTVLLQNTGDDNERSAYVITMFLQTIITSNEEHLSQPLHVNLLLNLYSYVNDYIKAYNDIHQMLDTGLPFPVVQVRCYDLSFCCFIEYSHHRYESDP